MSQSPARQIRRYCNRKGHAWKREGDVLVCARRCGGPIIHSPEPKAWPTAHTDGTRNEVKLARVELDRDGNQIKAPDHPTLTEPFRNVGERR